jgi:hypothetical protein
VDVELSRFKEFLHIQFGGRRLRVD